jgi:type VI secretion system FHA domain protein
MTLTLSILRCPDGVPPETRRLAGGELSIGRDLKTDWVLPDSDRVLSKRHCVVAFLDNAWRVTDTSANGTFLNSDLDRLAAEEPRLLRNGDRLLLGSYEIEVAIDPAEGEQRQEGPGPESPFSYDRLTGDPFQPLENDPLGIAMPPLALPAEFSRTAPDDVPALGGNFSPPRPNLELLPDDWDADLPDVAAPVPAPLPNAVAPNIDRPAPPPVEPAATPPALSPMGPPAPPPRPTAPVAADSPAGAQAFAAFAAGAGIEMPAAADPVAALHALGRAFRAVVRGLRRTMIARAAVKGEFRIEQTMIRESGNNPLKFSADDDDALAALIGPGRRGDMTAERAVNDAMRDIRLHELAVAAAMQQAVRELLARLAPAQVERRAGDGAFDFLPGRAEIRRWRTYEALHRETVQGLSDDFDRVFGTAFMRAYERAISELGEQQNE